MKLTYLILFFAVLLFSCVDKGEEKSQRSDDPISQSVDSLLSVMTLDEKLGQMTQMCFSTITLDGSKTLDLNADLFRESILNYHVGSFLSGTGPSEKWAGFIIEVQNIATKESRLGIPLIIGIDHVHGANYVDQGTILPHNLGLSCSFDPVLIAKGAQVVAKETAPLALSWNFAPVLDVGKNPTWPRLYETFGEDPLVCAELGSAFIRAYQGWEGGPAKLSACAKHFIGYSDPKSGWDRTPSEIPDQILYEQFLPSFQKAFDAGVKTVMVNSGEVNGEAVHGSEYYLKEILRNRLGFDGVVLTDIKDIMKMVEMHSAYATYKDALLAALRAGIDMTMACNHYEFLPTTKELIEEGKITEARIDESVRRILKLKMELGLFKNPYPDQKAMAEIGGKENYEAAKEAVAESIVLLKNDDLLPLSDDKKILLAGFAANSRRMLNGPWTLEWLGAEEDRHRKDVPTLYEAFKSQLGNGKVTVHEGNTLAGFTAKAQAADVIVITIGEEPYSEFKGNINDMNLAQEQQALVQKAYSTGKPVVLLLLEGRPRIISGLQEKARAILFCGYPGHGGAEGIFNVLSGKANPSGKLTFTYPSGGSYFSPYYHKKSEYIHSTSREYPPLYEFGHGLSYSRFEYSNLQISDSLISKKGQPITVSVKVTNTSDRPGKETVLWFLQDEVGKIIRPVKQLKHFEKKLIPANSSESYSLTLIPEKHFTYPDRDGKQILEEGYYNLFAGDLSVRFQYLKGD